MYALRDEDIIKSELGDVGTGAINAYLEFQTELHRTTTPMLLPPEATRLAHTIDKKIEGNVLLVVIAGIPLYYTVYMPSEDSFHIRQVLRHYDASVKNKYILFKQTLPVLRINTVGKTMSFFCETIEEALTNFKKEFTIFTGKDFRTQRFLHRNNNEEFYLLYGIGRPTKPLWQATQRKL